MNQRSETCVGVIIPVYNAAPFLEAAVDSALSQKETAEVILVEDGSTDESLSVCRRLEEQHPSVRLVRHPEGANLGAGASRNLGIRSSSASLLAFLDADDYYLPDRFNYPVNVLGEDRTVDGVYQAIGVHCEDTEARRKLEDFGMGDVTMLDRKVDPDELAEVLIAAENGTFSLDGLVVRRDIFQRCGHFMEKLRLHQDTAMIIQLACFGKLVPGSLTEPVSVRRVHAGNRYLSRYDNFRTCFALWDSLLDWAARMGVPAGLKAGIFLNRQYYLHKLYRRDKGLFASLARLAAGCVLHPLLSIGAVGKRRLRGKKPQP